MRDPLRRSSIAFFAASFAAAVLTALPAAALPIGGDHLDWAEDLVNNVTPEHNAYGTSPSYVHWAGVAGATQYENRTLCTQFLTIVLKQAHGYTDTEFRDWFGSTSPNSAMYHDTIVAEDGFLRITAAPDIDAGDIIAIKYPAGSSVTGHVAIARGPAEARTATAPLVAGTTQYALPVVDSSSTGHGPTDTRLLANGQWHPGAGFGVMRLYADANGQIVGYTWSTSTGSYYYDLSTRHIVVGRLL
ncbi:MAG: hypothetical protein IT372_03295 [Polyangiaceae bacterium]|nr:hypothetical protein [Polyangiaceae bacterium]